MPLWSWQKAAFAGAAAAIAAGAVTAPRGTLAALMAFLALPFFCVVVLRAIALGQTGNVSRSAERSPEIARGASLPRYSVLVPLLREATVVPALVAALRRIDYPADKLEILFIVESFDAETRAALEAGPLPEGARIVVVPEGEPRTKPRALNYALEFATGEYVTVYDAEDVPEPDQLLKALAVLRSRQSIGCVQSRLNIYNSADTWLTRQFTIEYTALFDCLLPALERLSLPVPLGGTSNHFPRAVLESVGGWDPFNVTEDADLGIRLARAGLSVEVLASTTWEEAPRSFVVWRGQRTRWLKGWIQTYLVHMREPFRLARELGVRRFLGFQVLMGGLLLSALVHPWFYVLAALDAAHGLLTVVPDSWAGRALWWLGVFNLVIGYATGVALGTVAVRARGQSSLAVHALLMPAYWLLISLAAYRALLQLAVAPYLWEKTEHGGVSRRDCPEGEDEAAAIAAPASAV